MLRYWPLVNAFLSSISKRGHLFMTTHESADWTNIFRIGNNGSIFGTVNIFIESSNDIATTSPIYSSRNTSSSGIAAAAAATQTKTTTTKITKAASTTKTPTTTQIYQCNDHQSSAVPYINEPALIPRRVVGRGLAASIERREYVLIIGQSRREHSGVSNGWSTQACPAGRSLIQNSPNAHCWYWYSTYTVKAVVVLFSTSLACNCVLHLAML